jgi:hypothetical protein
MLHLKLLKLLVLGQVGAGAQVILAKPAPGILPSDVKTKVKHPLAAEDVIDANGITSVTS